MQEAQSITYPAVVVGWDHPIERNFPLKTIVVEDEQQKRQALVQIVKTFAGNLPRKVQRLSHTKNRGGTNNEPAVCAVRSFLRTRHHVYSNPVATVLY